MLPYARAGISKNQVEELIAAITAESIGAVPDTHSDDNQIPIFSGGWGNATVSDFWLTVLNNASASASRSTLGAYAAPVLSSVDPTTNENSGDGYADGQVWVNQSENTSFILLDSASGYWRRL